jgi:rRNA-processing protein FCF1
MLIILDTSMLMLPLEKKVNLTYELERLVHKNFEIVVPLAVLKELEELLEKGKQSTKLKAKLAIELANKFSILHTETNTFADEEILRLALEKDAIVATNDSELRLKLRERGITVISLHGKNKLSLFGDI